MILQEQQEAPIEKSTRIIVISARCQEKGIRQRKEQQISGSSESGRGYAGLASEDLGEVIGVRITYASANLAYGKFSLGKKDLGKVHPEI